MKTDWTKRDTHQLSCMARTRSDEIFEWKGYKRLTRHMSWKRVGWAIFKVEDGKVNHLLKFGDIPDDELLKKQTLSVTELIV